MTADLARLLSDAQLWLAQAFIVFLRVGGAMALMPAFGEQIVPARVRLVAAFAFTLVTLSGTDPVTLGAATRTAVSPTLLSEMGVGLAIGAMLRLFVLALQTAGMMIAQSISLAQMFGVAGESQPAVSTLLTLGGLALAAHLGLHIKIAALLIASYDAIPPRSLPSAEVLRLWGLGGVAQTFSLAFSIAMPFVLGGLLYNIALGAINRAMPQMMVTFIGAPALTFGGLVLLTVAVPTGLLVWSGALDRFLSAPFEVHR